MRQVGEILSLTLTVTPPSDKVYSYIWQWWDGTVSVTTEPTVGKTINLGGDPTAPGRKLQYSVTAVLEDGQNSTVTGEVEVNNPPSIVPAPTVSVNDRTFPYQTAIALTAYDLENDAISFAYYLNGTNLGSGVSSYVGQVNGTWNGTYVGQFSGTHNVFQTTVNSDRTVTLQVSDSSGGTTLLDFSLRGQAATHPVVASVFDSLNPVLDTIALADQRIGVGQVVDFTVYAIDETGGPFTFLWNFAGSNGWNTLPVFSSGTTAMQVDGSVRNNVLRDISGETAGTKLATCRVTNTTTNKVTDVAQEVDLVANQVATSGTLAVKVNSVGQAEPISASLGDLLEYDLVVLDPDADIVTYRWTFTLPDSSFLRLWGSKVVVDTTALGAGSLSATVQAIDRFNAVLNITAPSVSLS